MRNVIYESSRYDEQENVIEGAMDSSRWPSLASGILLCFLLFAQQGGGQAKSSPSSPGYSPQETAPPAIPMLDEGKGIIHLDVAVMNGDGEPVSGLSRGDFELLDEGRPQKIRSFHAFSGQLAGPEPPAQAILFFDTLCGPYSSCMSKGDELRAQAAIGAFLNRIRVTCINQFPSSEYQTMACGRYPITIRPREIRLPRICFPAIGSS